MEAIKVTGCNGDNIALSKLAPKASGFSTAISPVKPVSQSNKDRNFTSIVVSGTSNDGQNGHAKRYGGEKVMVADHSSSETFIDLDSSTQ